MLIPLEYFIHFSLICNLSLLYLVHHLISHCVILQQNELIMLKIFQFKVTVKFYLGFLSTYCLLIHQFALSGEKTYKGRGRVCIHKLLYRSGTPVPPLYRLNLLPTLLIFSICLQRQTQTIERVFCQFY